MKAAKKKAEAERVLPRIFTVWGFRVVLDTDLAKLYDVPPKQLNQAVRRNGPRFPADFSFSLTNEEAADWKSQTAAPSSPEDTVLRSQSVTFKNGSQGKHRKYLPRVFTEHGALMAANVLRSARAVEMSVYLVRAFVQMREALLANTTILKRLAEIDHRLIEHDSVLREIVDRLQPLLDAPAPKDETTPKIGFHRGNR